MGAGGLFGKGSAPRCSSSTGGFGELPVTSVPLSAPLAGQEQEAEAPLRHPLHVRGPGVPAQEAHREEGTERGWGQRRGPRPPSVRVVLGGPGWPGGAQHRGSGVSRIGSMQQIAGGTQSWSILVPQPCSLPGAVACSGYPGGLCTCRISSFPLFPWHIFRGWFRAVRGNEEYNVHLTTEAHAQDAIFKRS